MWIKSRAIVLIPLFIFSISYGQEKNARQIVETLCSDTLYGRGYVNNGVNKAATFLENKFKEIGLKPFFGDTSYIQHFTFDVNTFPRNIRATSDDYFYKPGIDFLVDEHSGSFSGNLYLIELDIIELENKTLLSNAVKKVQTSSKNGFLIDLTLIPDENLNSIKQQCNLLSSIGTVVYLTNKKFTWSVARVQTQFPILYFQKSIFINSLLSINIEAKLIENFPNKNIIGYIPSTQRSKKDAKTIVFSAHYDHLGMMGTTPPTIFPGGNDNASGTAILLSLAEHFKRYPSEYNIVFIAFAGEEVGLLGSKYFVENNTMDLSKIKLLINLDIMGSGEEGITAVNGTIFKKEFNKLQKINKKGKFISQIKSRGEAANSDHWYFYKSGVPSIFLYTMGPNKNYHDIHDTYANLSFSAYNNIVKLLVRFIEIL